MILTAPIYTLKRRAKDMARAQNLPLHKALDSLARTEGYQNWSHLAATDAATGRAARLLAQLTPGALILCAARPGQGKTLLALEILTEAAKTGRFAAFFTFEYTRSEVLTRLSDMQGDPGKILIDTSDAISADHITKTLADAPPKAVVVLDYLQLLDQRRDTAPLNTQINALKSFSKTRDLTLICISQVDRHFSENTPATLPGLTDLRLPNPLDLTLFDRALFLHNGQIRLQHIG